MDEDRRIYVADTGNHRIQVFDRDFNPITQWGQQGEGQQDFNNPGGIALYKEIIKNDDGDELGYHLYIYIADTLNHRIQVYVWTYKYYLSEFITEKPVYLITIGGLGTALGRMHLPITLP